MRLQLTRDLWRLYDRRGVHTIVVLYRTRYKFRSPLAQHNTKTAVPSKIQERTREQVVSAPGDTYYLVLHGCHLGVDALLLCNGNTHAKHPFHHYQLCSHAWSCSCVCLSQVSACPRSYIRKVQRARYENAPETSCFVHHRYLVCTYCRWTHVSSLVDEAHSPAAVAVKYALLERKEMKLCIPS